MPLAMKCLQSRKMGFFNHLMRLMIVLLAVALFAPALSEAKPPPQNGVIREYYPSRRIRLEFRYKNGLLVRKRFWYNNGRLMSDYLYRDGKPIKKRDFYQDGGLKSIWVKKSGILKVFNADGTLRAAIPNRADGLF